jgi:hypothetical protein
LGFFDWESPICGAVSGWYFGLIHLLYSLELLLLLIFTASVVSVACLFVACLAYLLSTFCVLFLFFLFPSCVSYTSFP